MSSQSSAASAVHQNGVAGQIPAIQRDLDKLFNRVAALSASLAALTSRLDLLAPTSGALASVAAPTACFHVQAATTSTPEPANIIRKLIRPAPIAFSIGVRVSAVMCYDRLL